ncbi:MAG TPA: reverse transcriptase-like protein [Chloroflexota bacterium]|nr:reverse transcriptase-like protein [Chloroflexota bacterium]
MPRDLGASIRVEVRGLSRGNPGLSGAGVIVRDSNGRILERAADFLGASTPIRSEYEAVLRGLMAGLRLRPSSITLVLSDEAVWRQLTGVSHACLPETASHLSDIGGLIQGDTPIEINLVDPEEVEQAEHLANLAVESRGRRLGGDDGILL